MVKQSVTKIFNTGLNTHLCLVIRYQISGVDLVCISEPMSTLVMLCKDVTVLVIGCLEARGRGLTPRVCVIVKVCCFDVTQVSSLSSNSKVGCINKIS